MIRAGTWLSLAALALVGCSSLNPFDWGSHHHHKPGVSFSYASCTPGCSLGDPLLTGVPETILVTGSAQQTGVTAVSSDTNIATFVLEHGCACEAEDGTDAAIPIAADAGCDSGHHKHCENTVELSSKVDGDVVLTLRDATDAELAHATVHIRNAAAATFYGQFAGQVERSEQYWLEMKVGERVTLEVDLRDDRGEHLLAPRGVTWDLGDASLASLSAHDDADTEGVLEAGLTVDVTAKAPGQSELSLKVPGFTPKLKVIVKPAD